MRFVTFADETGIHVGLLDSDGQNISNVKGLDRNIGNMLELIRREKEIIHKISKTDISYDIPVVDVTIMSPVPRPPKNIFCVGKNYPDHVNEIKSVVASATDTAGNVPEHPIIFTKAPSSVIGGGESIPASLDYTDSVDYEGELAVIIGQGGRGIARENAMSHVFGYSIINDVTSRRLQRMHQQWFMGKSLDGFCPMGPCLVHKAAIDDVTKLRIQTRVNDELRQDGFVYQMIFDIPCLIEALSRTMTLEPGDVIATGTPAGVGMGFKPPKFLKKGDVVSITIEPIGTLINPVE